MTKIISLNDSFVLSLFLSLAILLSGLLMLPNLASAQDICCERAEGECILVPQGTCVGTDLGDPLGQTCQVTFPDDCTVQHTDTCTSGTLDPGDGSQDLLITAPCNVGAGEYQYRNVNIINNGVLNFVDESPKTDFWAKSILVEAGGTLKAGEMSNSGAFGVGGGKLTIYLYGSDNDLKGIECRSPQQTSGVPCGIDRGIWNSNTLSTINPTSCVKNDLPGGVDQECFYQYDNTPDPITGESGMFGAKVLGVSYGGTLELYGSKGANYNIDISKESGRKNSGASWVRLDGSLSPSLSPPATSLKVDIDVDWQEGDHIVVTTTDYLPGHSEKLEITEKTSSKEFSFIVLDPHTNDPIAGGLQYPHNGNTFPVSTPSRLKQDKIKEAETRAAVALLSRSIRVVSAGNEVGDMFGPPTPGNFFGGQTMFRQGFQKVQIQGVEFYQLGQGGRKGRYPVHFHLARKVPDGTFARDNSVHESMTRWITLHGSQNVELSRNVGFMSIGHGYYLEDGTETDNKLYSNIGILARAAIINDQNPRRVPGILAYPNNKIGATKDVPFRSDYLQPTVFWIMNGWNDFEYNMAAGANTCGACYWWLPAQISGPSQLMKWESYASQQSTLARAGDTPLKKFKGNYCTSAMNSFNTPPDLSPCEGIGGPIEPFMDPVAEGNLSPLPPNVGGTDDLYYPKVAGAHTPTFCTGTDCSTSPPGCSAPDPEAPPNLPDPRDNCAVTVIEDYTTAFHWTEVNFSAIWLRPQWYLVTNSVISDVLGAGLTFVTGGDYTVSNVIPGQWQLARKNVFIGKTQAAKEFPFNYASEAGPINPNSDYECEKMTDGNPPGNRCVIKDQGLAIPLVPFNNQRLYNIYDGPNFEDSNAFLNVKTTHVSDCEGLGNCAKSKWMYGVVNGMPKDPSDTTRCILPNAAIAWKQPNGFFYPPAFHSSNLYFSDVDIRHYVVQPLFEPLGPDNRFAFKQDDTETEANYCTFALNPPSMVGSMFGEFSAIDRQTILNDDDGTLTGLIETISVNEDEFFDAPVETVECASLETAKTSPYEHVTTVVYPGCVAKGKCGGTCAVTGQDCADNTQCVPVSGPNTCDNTSWTDDCANQRCYGVPLYRQYLTGTEESNTVGKQIRMMGMNFFQRSNLTANNGIYYMDTTVSKQDQKDGILHLPEQRISLNVFEGGEIYYVLFLFAQESTKQTYLIYVGDGFDPNMNVSAISSTLTKTRPLDVKDESWPAGWTRKWYKDDPSTGILEVSVDFSSGFDFDKARMDRCQPKSFCTWTGDASSGSCECSTDLPSSLYDECTQKLGSDNNTICSWSVRAVDCPEGGCRGFAFTLPAGFDAATITKAPPTPECFPSGTDSPWDIDWNPAGDTLAGEGCVVKPLPGKNFCDDTGGTGTVRNEIIGTPGDDVLRGTMGADHIMGFGGDDEIDGRGGDDIIEGGPGDDNLDGNMGDDKIIGGEGNDLIMGGKGHDDIDAGEGDDFVKGGAGNDYISGGDGSDVLIGQRGNDEIDGNAGDDMIEGNQGADDIDGGSGDDSILGGAGGDEIDGGSGDDMIEGGGGPDTCTDGESGSICENE
ncbi:MAG: calcium-binding protein [Candidatus Dadabacteria bacterium]